MISYFLLHSVQTGAGALQDPYPKSNVDSFPMSQAVRAWSWLLAQI